MPLNDIVNVAASRVSTKFKNGLRDVVVNFWDLGFTAFGGPPTHFKILHDRFVTKHPWLTEQLYQELFALTQALPGPASTKAAFCIAFLRGGLFPAFVAFAMWCLPGAAGMYGLSLGVHRIDEKLPEIVYALLTGLNGATVGVIALAAVELARRCVTDRVTRALVFLGGAAGMLYNSLWYFPVLMVAGGLTTLVWDMRWGHNAVRGVKRTLGLEKKKEEDVVLEDQSLAVNSDDRKLAESASRRRTGDGSAASNGSRHSGEILAEEDASARDSSEEVAVDPESVFSWKVGMGIVVLFFLSFIAIIVIRSVWDERPFALSVFANFYLAGTIIFGGGPVVIPLLREYIVAPGWVSSRDFLLGLAIIQAFPGPNFNFAVYLGSLAALNSGISAFPSFAGALVGFFGIFTPGIVLVLGTLSFWKGLRKKRATTSILRGVNAAAVGLIFTAVYRLYEIGFVDEEHQRGSSLGRDPWWVVVTATSFVGGAWFGVSPPVAILLGGIMGLVWHGIVKV